MRALWSRVAQTPGTCRCISCHSGTATIARRGAQGSLRGSWTLWSPTSTFVYTTIFAAGLSVDARAKAKRNKQWENAFAQLQEAMDQPFPEDDAQNAAFERAGHDESTSSDHAEGTDPHVTGSEKSGDTVAHSRRDAAARKAWDALQYDSRFPGEQWLAWPANTGRDLNPYHLPPQSLWAPDTLRLSAMRRRHTWKKVAMQELSAGLLVHNLIRHINLANFLSSTGAKSVIKSLSPLISVTARLDDEQAADARSKILASMERVHLTDVNGSAEDIMKARTYPSLSCPAYFQDADGDFYDICGQMNKGIKQLLGQCAKNRDKDVAIAVAKVCHNLLVSTAAPDIQTFNILLSGFRLLGRDTLVDDVIASFYGSSARPNEITCRLILNHYTAQSRPDQFSRFVARMRGYGDALMLANPSITINEASQGRLLRLDSDKVYQKVHPTPMVLGALIDGVMRFAGFDRALDIYYELKADGWGLHTLALTRLLADCIHRMDWEGGTYVWGEIDSIEQRTRPKHLSIAYYHMLSLCSVTGNTVAFNQVLHEVVRRHYDRREIIRAALDTTKRARKMWDFVAPEGAADQLMIAASAYVKDVRTADNPLDDSALDDTDFDDDLLMHQPYPEMSQEAKEQADAEASKDAWSTWVEHEFGIKAKQDTPEEAPQAQDAKKPADPDASKDAWKSWYEHEFGIKAEDSKE